MAKELAARGYRTATSSKQLRKDKWKDPGWLTWLHSAFSDMGSIPYVLVTYDNNMPDQHAQLLATYETTVAIVDSKYFKRYVTDLDQVEYWREVVHRHAHRMFVQPPGTILKYRTTARRLPVTLP